MLHKSFINYVSFRIVIYGFDKDSLTMLLCTVAFAVSISVGILLSIHIYLTLTNQVRSFKFNTIYYFPLFNDYIFYC